VTPFPDAAQTKQAPLLSKGAFIHTNDRFFHPDYRRAVSCAYTVGTGF
jgi:hypothetical protein